MMIMIKSRVDQYHQRLAFRDTAPSSLIAGGPPSPPSTRLDSHGTGSAYSLQLLAGRGRNLVRWGLRDGLLSHLVESRRRPVSVRGARCTRHRFEFLSGCCRQASRTGDNLEVERLDGSRLRPRGPGLEAQSGRRVRLTRGMLMIPSLQLHSYNPVRIHSQHFPTPSL